MPVSGPLTAVGSNTGRWGISPRTLKLFCPDAGTNPANKTKEITRILWRILFKTIVEKKVINTYDKFVS